MLERRSRWILIGAMSLALLFPYNWVGIAWYSMEYGYGLINLIFASSIDHVSHITHSLSRLLFLLAGPILALLNIILALFPIRKLKAFYRIPLPVVCSLEWYELFQVDPAWRRSWYLAIPVIITVAVLMEIVLAAGEWRKKPESTALPYGILQL
jgi:hypothetical protein